MKFYTKGSKEERALTVPLQRSEIEYELFTDSELVSEIGGALVFDVECYPNYFLIAFKSVKSGKIVYFEQSPDSSINFNKLGWVLYCFTIVGFNSIVYDIVVVWLAINGASCATLKEATDLIILEDARPSDIERKYQFRIPQTNHIDLIEVAPLSASLKMYAGRLHCPRMQDLPYNPNQPLTQAQGTDARLYCFNDLTDTVMLYLELCPQIALRESLGALYGQDLRSKSDAQIAEAVISTEVAKLNGRFVRRPKIEEGTTFKYNVPDFIQYKTPRLNQMLQIVKESDFVVRESGKVVMPPAIDALRLNIGFSTYKMGIGGLHSTESSISHKADENTLLIDRDVASYYPAIILNLGLYPQHMGTNFLDVYRSIVRKRLKAKKDKDKTTADSLKITINGGFGKFGDRYSALYSPHLLIGVTVTGQLSLLMLIEAIELVGIPVVSGNTDGIVIKCPKNRYEELNAIIKDWEERTNFETEETRYKAIYCRDVNNYFAIKEDDEVKVKGCYAEKGSALNSVLSKNPENLICSDAIKNLIVKNIPIEETIYNCKDIRRFITLRNVKGGARKDNVYLGKAVRWYFAKGCSGQINYVSNGNKVANSEGAKPIMDLPPHFPDDVDYRKYIELTNEMLTEISYFKPAQLRFF